jgi:hypothetical protein
VAVANVSSAPPVGPRIDDVLAHYRSVRDALRVVERQRAVVTGDPASSYFGLAEFDFDQVLRLARAELDREIVFAVVAATETVLFRDFFRRVERREKTQIRLAMKSLYRDRGDQVTLNDLLVLWTGTGCVTGQVLDRM